MSILDDAIREHLELKRAHGADESEVKKLEDEAFGPPQRPDEIDPFAEAPTEFLGMPEAEARAAEAAGGGRRLPNIADLQEAPEPPKPEAPADEQQPAGEQALPDAADLAADAETEAPAEPQEPRPAPDTQERHAIADHPTELFDVESAIEADPDASTEVRSPSDEDLAEAEAAGPRLSPVDPLAGIDASEAEAEAEAAEEPVLDSDEEEDDFFSEQRLSDELDQALEAPVTDEHPVEEATLPVPGPEPDVEEEEEEDLAAEPDEQDAEDHEDVLEDTPDFLEDAPEDDNLWFEQRPPKDFDFDD